MPYKTIEELPNELKSILPDNAKKAFINVFNNSYNKHNSEATAFATAWSVIKQRFNKVEGKWVANSNDYIIPTLYTFELEQPVVVVMNAELGELVMDGVLATTELNSDGKHFDKEDLEELAVQINNEGSTLPDVDHEVLANLIKTHGNNYNIIKKELSNKKGLFKNIKAVVEDGKLWIRAILDKRYKNHVDKFKGLSIEAVADADVTGRLRKPVYFGFTFTNSPKLRSARIAN